ncbi:MAG: DAK2 domain-containing protein, partial [Anaerolineae bacterium]|nr:DAK2 domain-containing protein [Anaerolineae bacterium]
MAEPITACDGQTFKRLAEAGKLWLEHNYKTVNDLNVFPVPDGDTGTNMLLTMQNAYREVADESSSHVGEIARKIAHGAIMGSRGNSGTIMSQIWTGFSQTIKDLETLDANGTKLALRAAADKAYQGVQSPV